MFGLRNAPGNVHICSRHPCVRVCVCLYPRERRVSVEVRTRTERQQTSSDWGHFIDKTNIEMSEAVKEKINPFPKWNFLMPHTNKIGPLCPPILSIKSGELHLRSTWGFSAAQGHLDMRRGGPWGQTANLGSKPQLTPTRSVGGLIDR